MDSKDDRVKTKKRSIRDDEGFGTKEWCEMSLNRGKRTETDVQANSP